MMARARDHFGPDVVVRARSGWLLLERRLYAGTDEASLCRYLRMSGELAGSAKLALDPLGRLSVRAELPLDDEDGLGALVESTRKGFEGLVEDGDALESGLDTDVVSAALDGAGYEYRALDDRAFSVALVESRGLRARVEATASSTLRCSLPEVRVSGFGTDSRRALSWLLLRANASIRFARASLVDDAVRFDVGLGAVAGEWLFDRALTALAVAARFYHRDVSVLEDGTVSRAFLSFQKTKGGKP